MLSRIEANLRSFKPAINELPERRASVLIPLLEREGQTLLLLTKRSEKLRSHSGQVSFPGGKQDAQDQSSLDTALREAREEIGLESKKCENPRLPGPNHFPSLLSGYSLCRFDPFRF